MYTTRTRVHARIPNGHPREEKRASDKSRRTSRRAEQAASAAAVGAPDTPEVGEEVHVGVGVRVGPVEFKLNSTDDGGYANFRAMQTQKYTNEPVTFGVTGPKFINFLTLDAIR